jgi:hypothetical protein
MRISLAIRSLGVLFVSSMVAVGCGPEGADELSDADEALGASAAGLSSRSFSLSTASSGGGYATASGTVSFSKSTATVSASIKDHCPGDSAGSYLYVRAKGTSGDWTSAKLVVKDTNGCGNGRVSGSTSISGPGSSNIREVLLSLCEDDSADPTVCPVFDRVHIDNPET